MMKNCALKLVNEIILYYDARSKKHQIAIGLSPGGRSTVHIYTQTIRRTIQNKQYIGQHNNLRTTQQFRKSAGRAPSWLVIPWHLPYNRGKSTEKPQSG